MNRYNWYYKFDYDIEYSDCICDDFICRCKKIVKVELNDITISTVVDGLLSKFKLNPNEFNSKGKFTIYCLTKIAICLNLNNKDNFYVDKSMGYYGEEVDGIYLNNNVESDLNRIYKIFRKCQSNIQRVNFLLELENGYILNDLKDKAKVVFEKIPINAITINTDRYGIVKSKDIEYLDKEHPDYSGVVLKQDGGYRLIDGYHRYVWLHKNNKKEANYIVIS